MDFDRVGPGGEAGVKHSSTLFRAAHLRILQFRWAEGLSRLT